MNRPADVPYLRWRGAVYRRIDDASELPDEQQPVRVRAVKAITCDGKLREPGDVFDARVGPGFDHGAQLTTISVKLPRYGVRDALARGDVKLVRGGARK